MCMKRMNGGVLYDAFFFSLKVNVMERQGMGNYST